MKDLSRRSRPLLIMVALWLLSWLISLLVQEPYQRDTLLVCRCILLFLFGIQLHARHRAKGMMSRVICVLLAVLLLSLQLRLIPFLQHDIIIGFIDSQTLVITLLYIYLGYMYAE